MVIDMNEQQLNTAAQLRAFLNGTQEVQFEPKGEDSQRYAFIAAVVKRLHYGRLSRPDKGVVMRYLERTTRYSHAQLKRLVRRARHGETLTKRYTAPEQGFARKFTAADVALLAETDAPRPAPRRAPRRAGGGARRRPGGRGPPRKGPPPGGRGPPGVFGGPAPR